MNTIMPRLGLVLGVMILGQTPAACRPEDQRTETLDPRGERVQQQVTPEVQAQLDSGNTAYRVDDYDTALRHYTRATELAPDFAAGWFGVYMVQHRLGNPEAADSAYRRAQAAAPGATLIHPAPSDTMRADTMRTDTLLYRDR